MYKMLLKILDDLIDEEERNYITADNIGYITERERASDAIQHYQVLKKKLKKTIKNTAMF